MTKEERKAYMKAWREKNKEKIEEYRKKQKSKSATKKKPYDPNFKKCPKCKETFPRTKEFFYAQKDNKDGLRYHCKQCSKKDHIKNRERNLANVKAWRESEAGKNYYESNKEKIQSQGRERLQRKIEAMSEEEYEKYREEKNKKRREYYKANPDKEAERRKKASDNRKRQYQEFKQKHGTNPSKKQRQLMKAGVYKITCLVNNMVYVGGSTHVKQRWYGHKSMLRHNKHTNPILQDDWNEFGEDSFVFEVIEEMLPDTPKSIVRERELHQLYILTENNIKIYNILNITNNPNSDEKVVYNILNITNNPNSDEKICSKCKACYPRTSEYFAKCKNRIDKLYPSCKKCKQDYDKKRTRRIM